MRRPRINSDRVLAVLACLACASAAAQEPEAEDQTEQQSGWSAGVGHDESKHQEEETTQTMRLRVYDDLDRHPGADDPSDRLRPGVAIDVETGFVTCPDGHTRVERVNVGGREFDIDSECARARQTGKITIERNTPGPATQTPESSHRSTGESHDE